MGSSVRVGRVLGLVGSWNRRVCPFDADDSVKELWIGDGVVVSWARVGCVTSLAGS